jgi:hypothetical protein
LNWADLPLVSLPTCCLHVVVLILALLIGANVYIINDCYRISDNMPESIAYGSDRVYTGRNKDYDLACSTST